ncbi:SDR family NAD(P)-dependent oxidoreductase [Psychroserpens sp.]|uniref:SDR family NAD(P)-dependent oxidoreductase n=1 Tax=Psychroserpens sp. TaxID=2020870 RepID=UPI001B28A0A3|nr:SDR family NAD(P)-dependent oxidoreductase [Psychroserpens sp.]MBO6606498.1 SDR family NAD(P)-dependent oxidoreductase [Psychroserpens sp.]MBO6630410.1 SDR family NAD(P)-dependent oxidoreductase [Psychroserpens sp.]MBO6653202.1 SDR family NAD(P)-dependent oxidoreductase [Psychroserpens sp.]MBO6680770.1 SDR family NAD(P)-dependent oxidoreductase [Psychroserpens sp.]MBO6750272.1 SDR family NAD(P)-dependent oxidoreductase [Psychroserpens sp.]
MSKQKTVVITGASKGIGKALAERLLSEGYKVFGTSRSEHIEAINHPNFTAIQLDISSAISISTAQKTIAEMIDGVDILINNAGIGPDLGYEVPDPETFQETFKVNVEGVVFFTEPLLELMNSDGKILNISSKMGSVEYLRSAGSIAYRMSKSALNMYTKTLALRLQGVSKVAAIHPGWVKTTIMLSNIELAPLTPEDSAERIYKFLISEFETGSYYDAEDNTLLPW